MNLQRSQNPAIEEYDLLIRVVPGNHLCFEVGEEVYIRSEYHNIQGIINGTGEVRDYEGQRWIGLTFE